MKAINIPVLEGDFGQESADVWVARIPTLGVFAYGDTAEGARARAQEATSVLLRTIAEAGGLDAAVARLDRAGVRHDEMPNGGHFVMEMNGPQIIKRQPWSTSAFLRDREERNLGEVGGLVAAH